MESLERSLTQKSVLHPEIQDYSDYRKFLSDFYYYKKSLRSGFSFRKFSSLCGFKSPNYLQLIIKAERNLSIEMANSVAKGLGLTKYEQNYFISLVHQENAQTDDELNVAKKESLVAIKKLVTQKIKSKQSDVFSKWYHLLVRELVVMEGFEPSAEWITKMLDDQITLLEAESSWEFLRSSGLVKQNSLGQWIQTDTIIDSGDGIFQALLMNKFHAQNLKRWSHKLDSEPADLHELGLLNIPLNKEKIPEFRRRIREFQDEIIGWLQNDSNPNALVQLGTYLFRIK